MLLDKYASLSFILEDGSLNLTTIVSYTTDLLALYGLKITDEIQSVAGITIYPKEYFNPLNDNTGSSKSLQIHIQYTGTARLGLKSTLGV